MRYFIQFSYDGTAYHGWQVQPNATSVQQKLNECLAILLREEIETIGAGRTDTGVHAAMMIAHFDYDKAIDEKSIVDKLNRLLPPDIAVQQIYAVEATAHARFDATSRTYHYRVYTGKQPFLRHYALRLFFTPDYDLMNEAAKMLLQTSDFTSFSKVNSDAKTNICKVSQAHWVQESEHSWRFEITADRFLRNMVRAVVGTLLEVGKGKLSLAEFEQVIAAKNRCKAGESVAAHALFLMQITYPY